MKKIIIVFFIIMLVTPIFLIQSNATQGEGTKKKKKMGELINSKWSDSTSASSKATSLLTTIIVGVKIAAVAVAIVMLLAVAMKYMCSSFCSWSICIIWCVWNFNINTRNFKSF